MSFTRILANTYYITFYVTFFFKTLFVENVESLLTVPIHSTKREVTYLICHEIDTEESLALVTQNAMLV